MGRSMLVTGLFASGFLVTVQASAFAQERMDIPTVLQEKIDQAEATCAEFDNGRFALEWGSIARVDLDGDGREDWVLNERKFSCSTAASIYSGTGGSMSHFLIDERLSSLLNQGWDITTVGSQRVLVADSPGSNCGGINPPPCMTASVWDREEKVWRSAGAKWE